MVRIKVPCSRDDVIKLKKTTSQEAPASPNKIRIAVNIEQQQQNGSKNRASLEESFNSKLVMKSESKNRYIKSNSKSMTHL